MDNLGYKKATQFTLCRRLLLAKGDGLCFHRFFDQAGNIGG